MADGADRGARAPIKVLPVHVTSQTGIMIRKIFDIIRRIGDDRVTLCAVADQLLRVLVHYVISVMQEM